MTSTRIPEPALVNHTVTQILEQHFSGKEYDIQKSLEWSQQISDLVLEKLSSSHDAPNGSLRYKYIVNCSIQKHGSGLQSTSACLWNSKTDIATYVKFEHKDIDCTVHVYAVAFE